MENCVVKIDVSSCHGECHEIEQAFMIFLTQNELLPTKDGKVIDVKLNNIEVNSMLDKDKNSGIMDEPINKKRTTGMNQ